MATLADLRKKIITRLSLQHGNPIVKTKIDGFINDARNMLSAYGPWHFLSKVDTVSLVASQVDYSLATDFLQLNDQEVRLTTTKTRLYFLNDDDFMLMVTDPTAEGTPSYFRTRGSGTMQLYPVPDAAAVAAESSVSYEFFYRLATELSSDGDSTGLPEYAESLVLDLAESIAHQWTGKLDRAQMAFSRFMPAIQNLWKENNEILRLGNRDLPPALKIGEFEQMTQVDRS